jgi:cell wall-associated NlpC family hydrolase
MFGTTLTRTRSILLAAALSTTLAAPMTALPAFTGVAEARYAQSPAGNAAVREAARHAGKPYRYGATGPGAFDCSGFTSFVFRQVGVNLPRTSGEQHRAARPISKRDVAVGDLIFIWYNGRVGHVGIYAGDHKIWDAGRSGGSVRHRTIWTQNYTVGRVGE